jgi:hypothetical protein
MATIRDLAAKPKETRRRAHNHAHVVRWEVFGRVRQLRCECGATIVAQRGRAWIRRAAPG